MTDLLLPVRGDGGRSRDSIARSCPHPPHAVPRLRRAVRRHDLPPAGGGAARHRAALRGQGQPRPGPAGGTGRLGLPVRRGQPGRDHRRPDGRRRSGRPRLLQPGEAARGRAVRRPPRRGPVRRRLPRRGRQGRRGRARQRRAVPAGHLGRRVGLAAVAQVRLLDRRGGRDPARRCSARAARRRHLLPRRLPAARPRGVGRARSVRPPRSSRRSARTDSTRGCSTSVAASRPGSTMAARHRRRTAPRSTGTWPPPSATAGRPRSPSPVAASPRTPASWSPPWSASLHRAGTRWVFLDAGVFTGLVETLDEAIRYPLATDVPGPTGPCVLSGPTCDSADVLYQDVMVELPLALAEGDQVRFHCAGVYTATYSTVGFNGFAPLDRGAMIHRKRELPPRQPTGRPAAARRVRLRLDRHRAALAAAAGAGLGPVRRRPARSLDRRPGRGGPDGAVRAAVMGGRLARRPCPARPAGPGDDGAAAGVPGRRGRRGRERPRRARRGRRRARGRRADAGVPRHRGRAARAGRRPTGARHRAARDHRGLGLGGRPGARRPPARRVPAALDRCRPRSPWPPLGLLLRPASPFRARWTGHPTRWPGCCAWCCAPARRSARSGSPGCSTWSRPPRAWCCFR